MVEVGRVIPAAVLNAHVCRQPLRTPQGPVCGRGVSAVFSPATRKRPADGVLQHQTVVLAIGLQTGLRHGPRGYMAEVLFLRRIPLIWEQGVLR